MKSEKGVTLTALVVYIVIFIIILTMVSVISASFYKNVGKLQESPKYITEFNKFGMFFVTDVKENTDINSVTSTSLEFADGTKYVYENSSIYRNGEKIAKNVKNFSFTKSDYTVDNFTKKIINVNAEFGNSQVSVKRNIDFVLKYW